MVLLVKDRVKDTSTTTGTGNFTVSGTAPTGFVTFGSVLSTSDKTFYCIQHQTADEWEVGLATYNGSNVLVRTTILASSNSGSAVSFSAGTKDVFGDMPASVVSSLPMNVKPWGAKGDGTTDDTTAIQAALDALKAAGGGELYFPPGTYKITSGLTYDLSATSGRFASRLRLRGAGPGASVISLLSVAGTAFTYSGNASYPEAYLGFDGLRFTGNVTSGSKGIALNIAAFCSFESVVIEAFDYQLDGTDVEQAQFSNCNFRWGTHGVRFNASVSTTSPNSLNFLNCAIANNSAWGLQATNFNAVNYIGGSIQYNGATGASAGTNWGAKISECGDGYGTVNFIGVAFEGNGGDGDLLSVQSTNLAIFNIIGNGFARPNSTSYGVNNIAISGSTASVYRISGNEFRGYNTYTPNAARPYIANTNTSSKFHDDGSNIYGSSTEQPAWAGAALVDAKLASTGTALVGATTTAITAAQLVVHKTTDQNFYVGAPFWLPDGVAFGSINDANSTLKSQEFRGSQFLLTGAGGVAINTNAAPVVTGLDVKGGTAYKPVALTLANGANANVTLPDGTYFRITGPSAAFSISGLTGGVRGREIVVYNPIAQNMTITNDATSTAANRFLTLSGADLVSTGVASFRAIWDDTDSRWIIVSWNA